MYVCMQAGWAGGWLACLLAGWLSSVELEGLQPPWHGKRAAVDSSIACPNTREALVRVCQQPAAV